MRALPMLTFPVHWKVSIGRAHMNESARKTCFFTSWKQSRPKVRKILEYSCSYVAPYTLNTVQVAISTSYYTLSMAYCIYCRRSKGAKHEGKCSKVYTQYAIESV